VRPRNSPNQRDTIGTVESCDSTVVLGTIRDGWSVRSARSLDRPGQTRREAGTQSQGSLIRDRPAAGPASVVFFVKKEQLVKANLARFTWALTLLASMALTVGAGIRWMG
jgi:hypothetical protein